MGSYPDEARITAYSCLFEVLEKQGYSNLVLKQELAGSSLRDKEKAFVTAMVYGTITRIYTIDAMLAAYLKKPITDLDAPVRTCLRMGAWQVLFAFPRQSWKLRYRPAAPPCKPASRLGIYFSDR